MKDIIYSETVEKGCRWGYKLHPHLILVTDEGELVVRHTFTGYTWSVEKINSGFLRQLLKIASQPGINYLPGNIYS